MVKTHEINLNTSTFNQFTSINYIILEKKNIEVNDFILFKQVETSTEGEAKETGLFQMTQVKSIVEDSGLKDGFVLLIVNKI